MSKMTIEARQARNMPTQKFLAKVFLRSLEFGTMLS